jgi:hypothetical protein
MIFVVPRYVVCIIVWLAAEAIHETLELRPPATGQGRTFSLTAGIILRAIGDVMYRRIPICPTALLR